MFNDNITDMMIDLAIEYFYYIVNLSSDLPELKLHLSFYKEVIETYLIPLYHR